MINCWLAVERSNWIKFKDNFISDDGENPRRADFSRRMMKFLRTHTVGHWKAPTITVQGTDYEFHVLNLYISEDTVGDHQDPPVDNPLLYELSRIKQILPGKEFVLAAWHADETHLTADGRGVQYGQTVTPATYDEAGDELTPEVIGGTPVYPIINARIRKFLPDDVTYDQDGNETSRSPATAFKQVNKYFGQPDRYV